MITIRARNCILLSECWTGYSVGRLSFAVDALGPVLALLGSLLFLAEFSKTVIHACQGFLLVCCVLKDVV